MTITSTRDLMNRAVAAGRAVSAFNVVHLETAEALVAAAEAAASPVILQISQNCATFHGGLRPLALATLGLAEASTAEVAVHLDHAEDLDLVRAAVDLGFGSIMFDGGALDYDDNVARTRAAVSYAHAAGCFVEAELGRIGGKGGAHTFGVRTDPGEARRFVADTDVDALAVAVGSSHAMVDRSAVLDHELIAVLSAEVPVPLVLHGSSGASDDQIRRAVVAGMRKINVSSQLSRRFTEEVRAVLDAKPALTDSRSYFAAGRDAVTSEAARLMHVVSGG